MKTLFSPIGTADPITQLGDGPMLHIVRHYQPQRVVLFLSPKMQEFQHNDERYTKAIELLCATEGYAPPVVELEESSYSEVYRFDHYIQDFEEILSRLGKENPGETILINTSSGTSGMQQALVALGSFGRLPLTLLQVTTPRKGINGRQDRENPGNYDLDAMWAWNEELRNEDPSARESRIVEVDTPNFSKRLIRENIIALLEHYEYEAALELATNVPNIEHDTVCMIEAARDRLNLDGQLPAQVFAKSPLAYRRDDLLGEYLSVMEVRLEQGHWADFLRLLTPALTQTCRETLRRCGLTEQAYLVRRHNTWTSEINWEAVEKDQRLRRVLSTRNPNRRGPDYIGNRQSADLVQEYCQDAERVSKIAALRCVEQKCRNRLAHELTASSKETLERISGLSLSTVLEYLFDLHGNVRPHLYADISRTIISKL